MSCCFKICKNKCRKAIKSDTDLERIFTAAGDKLVVIDFFATWCHPCKTIAPKLEQLEKKYRNKVIVIRIDVDECRDLAMDYWITSVPTFYFIKNGKKVDTLLIPDEEMLEELFAKHAQ